MGMLLDIPIRFEVATAIKNSPTGVSRFELHPAFIKVPLFGHQRVTNLLVLDHKTNGESLSRVKPKRRAAQRRNYLSFSAGILPLDGQQIDGDRILEKLLHLIELLLITTESWDCGVRSEEPVRLDLSLLRGVVSRT